MEDLNINNMYQKYLLEALNRSASVVEASKLLGVSDKTVYLWKRRFKIIWDKKQKLYILNQNK